MRYVPIYCLREGMILAKDLLNNNEYQIMLTKDSVLTNKYIEGIIRIGYNGVYIKDSLSDEIEAVNVISDNLRLKAIANIKNVFIYTETKDETKIHSEMDLIKKRVEDIIQEILNNEHLMINMVDLKFFDGYTFQHSVNVAVLSIVLGIGMKLSKKNLYLLGLGALLHDVGKFFTDKEILNKKGSLSELEYTHIKLHSFLGYDYLMKEFNLPKEACIGVVEHHERYDGVGYPNGKKGKEISLFGRIIAIADVYDALVSERPYRKALLPSEAFEYIMGNSGSLFDSKIVSIFTKKIAPYPIGTFVKLSNDLLGMVIENYENYCLRPSIKIFKSNNVDIVPYVINLKDDFSLKNVTITELASISTQKELYDS